MSTPPTSDFETSRRLVRHANPCGPNLNVTNLLAPLALFTSTIFRVFRCIYFPLNIGASWPLEPTPRSKTGG